ncbi:MAG: carbonic anhydrase [Proteobacteria bacterium]|nr:carbonic anhydrase [Pseudomonadota bacterium]
MSEISSDRRRFLRGLGAAGLAAACPMCLAAIAESATTGESSHAAPHWGYEGEGAPDRWGSLQPNFKVCDLGLEQSPIDLNGAITADVGGVDTRFAEMRLRILNNGHTIQVNCDAGSYSNIRGERYELAQFHFHHPSEHLLSGKNFELECHFVHRSAAGALAVLGVFVKAGAANDALAPIWNAMPTKEAPELGAGSSIRPADLLPRERGYYRYRGSLTTPPCSEGVLWTVYKQPIEASPEQIRRFAALFPVNARPAMPLHRRYLIEAP